MNVQARWTCDFWHNCLKNQRLKFYFVIELFVMKFRDKFITSLIKLALEVNTSICSTLSCLVVWGSNKTHQGSIYQDFLKWGGGSARYLRHFLVIFKWASAFFLEIWNLTPLLQLITKEYSQSKSATQIASHTLSHFFYRLLTEAC